MDLPEKESSRRGIRGRSILIAGDEKYRRKKHFVGKGNIFKCVFEIAYAPLTDAVRGPLAVPEILHRQKCSCRADK